MKTSFDGGAFGWLANGLRLSRRVLAKRPGEVNDRDAFDSAQPLERGRSAGACYALTFGFREAAEIPPETDRNLS